MKKIIILLSLFFIFYGCGTNYRKNVKGIVIATPETVNGCRFLNEIEGESSTGFKASKQRAKMEAAKLGATHIVWDHMRAIDGKTSFFQHKYFSKASIQKYFYISGKAYKCYE